MFVYSKKEVIIAAGALNCPQLLMLSGIGPRNHLSQLGIPVIQNLDVGYNLMDHPGMIGITFLVNQSIAIIIDEIINDGSSLTNYLNYHTGPISVPAACEGIAFIDTKHPTSADGDPDLELLSFGGSVVSEKTYYKAVGIDEHVYQTVYKPIENNHTWQIVPITVQPKSRGRLMLKSSNPFDKPLIYYNFFEDPEDLEIQLLGVKTILELSKTKVFQKYGSRINNYPVPGCKHLKFGTDEYWRCAITHLATGIFHLSGTCKIGPASDPTAVVDARLRVYGVKGLRVIDASVMPMVPAAHTNFPTMMFGG